METFIIKIWSANRLQKKTFTSAPKIENVVEKAHVYGLKGCKLVLEVDGSQICDDESLELYVKEKTTLMLLDDNEEWTPGVNIVNISQILDQTASMRAAPVPENVFNVRQFIESDYEESQTSQESQDISKHTQNNSLDSSCSDIVPSIQSSSSNLSLSTTLSMSSGALSSSSENNSASMKLFSNFQIPWQKMPSDIINTLNNNEKLGRRLTTFSNIIVDELRNLSFYIPMGIFRSVAHQAASKYPHSLLEKDAQGKIISNTPVALLTTMKNRNNFLNRAPKRKKPDLDPEVPVKERRLANILQQTCENWQPDNINTGDSLSSLEYKKKYMVEIYKKSSCTAEERNRIVKYMKECYAVQRLFLNNRKNIPSIQCVLENWPFLFDKEMLFQHFSELMKLEPLDFTKNFITEKPKICKFLKSCRKKEVSTFIKEFQSEQDICEAIIKYFKETSNFLFIKFEIGTTLSSIKENIPTNAPWFAIVGKSLDEKDNLTYIFIEKAIVAKYNGYDFIDALLQIYCYFYVLNIMYPKEICQSMEFMFRYFFQYYSDNVRGSKKHINNISKINNLITKLRDLE